MRDTHIDPAVEAYLLTWKFTPLPSTGDSPRRVSTPPKPHSPVVEFLVSLGEVGIHHRRRARRTGRAVAIKMG